MLSAGGSMAFQRMGVEPAVLPLHLVFSGLIVSAGVAVLGLRLYESPATHGVLAFWTGLAGIAAILYARYAMGLAWLSASVVYLFLFWSFHFGLTFTAFLIPGVLTTIDPFELQWLPWPSARVSMVIAAIGVAGFLFGRALAGRGPQMRAGGHGAVVPDAGLYWGGWLMMLAGIAGSAAILARNGGVSVFSMGYLPFRAEILTPTQLQNLVDVSQYGCLMAVCGSDERRWKAPLCVWGVTIGVPMLIIGLRAELMIPLVTFPVILACRGIRVRRSLLVAAALASLVVIPAVKVIREVGITNRSLVSWTEVSPFDTFTELGGSLWATSAYVDWIERGDEYLLGASYWAPLDRHLLARLVPGRGQIPYEDDVRVPARLMEEAIGLSATGEAYYNFGSLGPFFYYAVIGVLFGLLERRATGASAYGCAILGAVMYALYFNLRGDWLPVPSQIAGALIVLAGCRVLANLLSRPAVLARLATP